MEVSAVRVEPLSMRPEQSQLALAFRRFRRNRLAVLSSLFIVVYIVVAFLAPVIAPYDPIAQELDNALQPPNALHWFGTDYFGRDILSRVLHGARVSMFVGLIVVGVALVTSVPIGLASGYFVGWVDNILMRIMDAILSFPPILLAIALMGALGPDIQNVMLALGLVQLPRFARLLRSSVLSAKENLYVEAARSIGARDLRILVVHILPNVVAPIVVQATVAFANAIISEASLSFLGLGVQPPTPSWGRDLSEGHRYLEGAPWLAIFPTMAIMVSVLSINFVGDGLRDALDPRLRTGVAQAR